MSLTQPIERRVDYDLYAYRTGPAALDQRLSGLPAAEVLARYRALLARVEHRAATGARRAWEDFDRAEARDETRQIRRGGNR